MKTSPRQFFDVTIVKRCALLAMVFVFLAESLHAGVKTSVATGNWNNAATWNPASVPTAADSVVIRAGHTVTLDANGTCGALTVNGALNYSANNNRTLTVTTAGSTHQGDVTISGTFAFTANNGQRLTLAGNFTCTGTFTNSTGNDGAIIFNGTGTKTITSSATLKSITVNNASLILTAGGGLSLTTNLTVTAGTFNPNGYVITGSGTNTLSVTGTLIVDAPTFAGSYPGWETRTLNAGSTVIYTSSAPVIDAALTYSNLTFSGTGTAGSSGNLTIQGNLATSGGGNLNFDPFDLTISGTRPSVTIAGFTTSGTLRCTKTAGTATLTNSVTAGSILINGTGGTLHLGTGLGHSTGGDVNIQAGTLQAGTCTLDVDGDWIQVGTFVADSSTINFRGSGPTVVVPATIFHNLRVNRPNGMSLAGNVTVNGTLTLSNGTLSIGAHTLTLNGDMAVNGGSLTGGATSNLIIGGSGASITLPAVALNDLTVNRASGITFGGNVAISGTLTVLAGTVNTAQHTLSLPPTGTVAIAGGGRIEGTVTKNFLGVETGMYRLMSMDNFLDIQTPGLTAMTIRSFPNQVPPEIPPLADSSRAVTLRYYQIADVAGTGVVRLQLDYQSSETGSLFTPNQGTLWKKTVHGQPWVDLGKDNAGMFFVEKSGIDAAELQGMYAIAEPGVLSFPVIAFSSTGLEFGNVVIGTGRELPLTVYNVGTSLLTISDVSSSSGVFAVSPTSTTIAPNDSAEFHVTFTPTSPGQETGTISFVHNASGSPHDVVVSGTGVAPGFSISSTAVPFGNVPVGSNKVDSVEVTNTGTSPLTIFSVVPNNAEFSVTPTSGSIPPSGSQTFYITFSPVDTGLESGSIVFTHDAVGSPHNVAVSGNGIAAVFASSLTEITFMQVPVGTSRSDSFWVYNRGNIDLVIVHIFSTNPHFAVNAFTATINPEDSISIRVTFSPDSARAYAGHIVLEHNGSTSPDTIRVAGDAITNVPDHGAGVPVVFELYQNYPNPFNPVTRIAFSVDAAGYTSLVVYNIIGQEVATLYSDVAEPQKLYTVDFNASALASGVYFYHLVSDSKVRVRKMVVMK